MTNSRQRINYRSLGDCVSRAIFSLASHDALRGEPLQATADRLRARQGPVLGCGRSRSLAC